MNEKCRFNIRLKEKQEREKSVEYMTNLIQIASTISTPAIKHQVPESHTYSHISRKWSMKNAELDAYGKILEIR
jgi:hypothetical protein